MESTFNRCKRNYFELQENHKCAKDCETHKWWCIIHIRDHTGCDCDKLVYVEKISWRVCDSCFMIQVTNMFRLIGEPECQ